MKVHFTFCPVFNHLSQSQINYHQLQMISNLRDQVRDSVGQLSQLQNSLRSNKDKEKAKLTQYSSQYL